MVKGYGILHWKCILLAAVKKYAGQTAHLWKELNWYFLITCQIFLSLCICLLESVQREVV